MDTSHPRSRAVPRHRQLLLVWCAALGIGTLLAPTACTTVSELQTASLRPLQKPAMDGGATIFERVDDYGQFADTNPVGGPIELLQGDHPLRQVATPIRGAQWPLVSNQPVDPDEAGGDAQAAEIAYPTEKGVASHYSYKDGRLLATGERYSRKAYTAAHKKLPFGTVVRVTRVDNGKSVVVTINDRGPYIRGRIIDLSEAPARDLGLLSCGIARCKVEVLAYPLIETMGPRGNG